MSIDLYENCVEIGLNAVKEKYRKETKVRQKHVKWLEILPFLGHKKKNSKTMEIFDLNQANKRKRRRRKTSNKQCLHQNIQFKVSEFLRQQFCTSSSSLSTRGSTMGFCVLAL